jgi:protein-L-isoaspartate(D-aspartate) O-methyltransferase
MLAISALLATSVAACSEGDFGDARRQMVHEVEKMAASIAEDSGVAKLDPRVLEAMKKVPRHKFVPAGQAASAYRNRPLPIGDGQTISQPLIVALMTHLLQIKETDKVLEIGTGSGYQAAILSALANKVFTIEIIPQLGRKAEDVLQRLGHANVTTKIGDGYRGWPEVAPFDGIIVTAAPDHIPPALVEQLKPGGRMVIPVGDFIQELMVLTKRADGTTVNSRIVPVRFVPLTRD